MPRPPRVGLVDTLRSDGPFTVLAPTDQAFAALDSRVLAYLLTPAGLDALTAILTYHVLPGRVRRGEPRHVEVTLGPARH